jgi:hypothetical protein
MPLLASAQRQLGTESRRTVAAQTRLARATSKSDRCCSRCDNEVATREFI